MGQRTDTNRIFGLDIIRTIAIMLVVLAHGRFLLKDSFLEGFPKMRMVDGVDIFFVLSGFLIGGILLKIINKPEGFKRAQLFDFWKRRWFRTLPNYYLILFLNYLVVKNGIIKEDISQFNYKFFLFIQNFHEPFKGFFWESWSLSIEEWFYLITPILIILLSRFCQPKYSFLGATVIMILFPIAYRMSLYTPDITSQRWDLVFRKVVLCRLDSIGYGLFTAWFLYYYKPIWGKYKVHFFIFGIALLFFLLNLEVSRTTVYKQVFYFSLVPISILFLFPLIAAYKQAKGIIPYCIQHISKISYSMYLINLALVAEVLRDNFPPQGGADSLFKYLVYWSVVIVVSSLLYRFFEKPIMDLRDR